MNKVEDSLVAVLVNMSLGRRFMATEDLCNVHLVEEMSTFEHAEEPPKIRVHVVGECLYGKHVARLLLSCWSWVVCRGSWRACSTCQQETLPLSSRVAMDGPMCPQSYPTWVLFRREGVQSTHRRLRHNLTRGYSGSIIALM